MAQTRCILWLDSPFVLKFAFKKCNMSLRGKISFWYRKPPCWSACIRESSFNLMPPSTTFPWDCFCETGAGRRHGGMFPPVFSSTVPVCFPSARKEGLRVVWDSDCIQRQKSLRGWISPTSTSLVLQGSCRMLGPAASCPPGLRRLRRGSCSVGWLGFWSGLFLWLTSTSSKEIFDETCYFCVSGCLLHHGIVMVFIICVCVRARVCAYMYCMYIDICKIYSRTQL